MYDQPQHISLRLLVDSWKLHAPAKFYMPCFIVPTYNHDDVIKWKHFPRNWPFVRESHRSLVNSPHKGQWRGALMFSVICVWINHWVDYREAGDLRRSRAHYDVTVMCCHLCYKCWRKSYRTWSLEAKWFSQFNSIVYTDSKDPSIQRMLNMLRWEI